MTENEVTQELKQLYDRTDSIYKSDKLDDMFKTIIISLEEIQQYRAIGTVEEIVDGIKQSEEEFNMLMEYLHIGTIDEVKTLKEKSVAEKPDEMMDLFGDIEYNCRACGEIIEKNYYAYCPTCGQKLD